MNQTCKNFLIFLLISLFTPIIAYSQTGFWDIDAQGEAKTTTSDQVHIGNSFGPTMDASMHIVTNTNNFGLRIDRNAISSNPSVPSVLVRDSFFYVPLLQTWLWRTPFIIDGHARVGIGTEFPQARLHVSAINDGLSNESILLLTSSNSDGLTRIGYTDNGSNIGLHFKMENQTNSIFEDVLFLKNNGKIGMGTASPNAKLHLNQPTTEPHSIYLTQTGTGNSAFIDLYDFNGDEGLLLQTSDNNFTTSWHQNLFLSNDGKVGIGTVAPQASLHVVGNLLLSNGTGTNNFIVRDNGMMIARQIDVHLSSIVPDYVFHAAYDADSAMYYSEIGFYKRMTLQQTEDFIKRNRHLPGIKSAGEYETAGTVNIAELQMKLLEKVEELTLYNIELNQELAKMKNEMEKLTLDLEILKAKNSLTR